MTKRLRDYTPALQYGAKIYPSDLAGMLGLPSVGEIYYVDAGAGSDSDDGRTAGSAFKTVTKAKTVMSADQDDVLIIASTNSSGRTSEAASIDWDLRRTHIIGNGPLRKLNPRNGIGFASTATTPCFTVSAKDCSFTNISIAVFEDINVLVNATGDYNSWDHVHFQGIGNATTGDDAAGRSLVLTGAEENEFTNCTIGIDTVARGGAANASLELTGSCPRNKFINCDFPIFTDGAEPTWVKADTGNCTERFLKFEGCEFMNPDGSSSTTLTLGMDLSATSNGYIYMINCNWLGATDLANNYDMLYTNSPTVDTANAGLMVIAAT